MDERFFCFLGVLGPIISYFSIAVSILLSPWFSWRYNALSDLGHSINSNVSSIFNFGLLTGGFLMTIYVTTIFRKYATYTSIFLTISTFLLQLIATFNEVYGNLHFVVSVLFFVSIGISTIVYIVEKRSYVGIVVLIVGLISWGAYGRWHFSGIAVPETISSIAIVFLIFHSAFRIHMRKKKIKKS